jgi:hypothetical protein
VLVSLSFRFRVFSGFPFFIHASPEFVEVVDEVAIFAAFDTLLLAGVAEAVASGDRPIMPTKEQMPNKSHHPTTMSGGVWRGCGVVCSHSG